MLLPPLGTELGEEMEKGLSIVFKILEHVGSVMSLSCNTLAPCSLTLLFIYIFQFEKESTLLTCLPRVPITALPLA